MIISFTIVHRENNLKVRINIIPFLQVIFLNKHFWLISSLWINCCDIKLLFAM